MAGLNGPFLHITYQTTYIILPQYNYIFQFDIAQVCTLGSPKETDIMGFFRSIYGKVPDNVTIAIETTPERIAAAADGQPALAFVVTIPCL